MTGQTKILPKEPLMSHPMTLLEPSKHQHRAPAGAEPPPGGAEDWTVPQHWDELTDEDHWVWDTLFARQKTLLHDKVVGAFEEGLDVLDKIKAVPTATKAGHNDVPVKDVVILSVKRA